MSWAGTIVDNRYEVKDVLGQGGMGVVLKARHKFTGADVAVKMLHEHLRLRADLVGRFLTEAQAPASIRHPGIVKITDAGTLPDGQPYLVMELLVGASLAGRLEQGPVSFEEARRIGLGILDALGAAHAAGFVHRDLKPDNVFVEQPSGAVKLLDFGIAKVLAEIDVPLPGKKRSTAAGAMMGTLEYMSPEQLRSSKNVDGRTDLWAVGVILYEMMTGKVPYEADDLGAMVVALYERTHRPVSEVLAGAPAGLDAFFERALAKDAGARFASAAEMAAALGALPAMGVSEREGEPKSDKKGEPDRERIETAPTEPSKPPSTVVRTIEQRPIELPRPPSTQVDTVVEPRPAPVVAETKRTGMYLAGAGTLALVVGAVVLIAGSSKEKDKDGLSAVHPSASADMAGWARIEPGTFDMGSPASEGGRYDDEAQHKVTITHAVPPRRGVSRARR